MGFSSGIVRSYASGLLPWFVAVSFFVIDWTVIFDNLVCSVRNAVIGRDFGVDQIFLDQIFVAFVPSESIIVRGEDDAVVAK